jgi:hypothetical protein
MQTRPAIAVALCLIVGMTVDSGGQSTPAPSSFGISDEAITTLSGFAFKPANSATQYTGDVTTGRWPTTAGGVLMAPLPEIPNGALLTEVAFHIQDNDGSADFIGSLCRHWTNSSTGANPSSNCPVSIASSGTGQTRISAAPNLTINYRFNIDGSGDVDVVSYTLAGNWGADANGDIRLRQVSLLWKRQVTPAPGTATFADVPVGHPIHRFVEALAASGITGGCGGGLYCPDALVTRGQMAVFLSAALGLHWPAF